MSIFIIAQLGIISLYTSDLVITNLSKTVLDEFLHIQTLCLTLNAHVLKKYFYFSLFLIDISYNMFTNSSKKKLLWKKSNKFTV